MIMPGARDHQDDPQGTRPARKTPSTPQIARQAVDGRVEDAAELADRTSMGAAGDLAVSEEVGRRGDSEDDGRRHVLPVEQEDEKRRHHAQTDEADHVGHGEDGVDRVALVALQPDLLACSATICTLPFMKTGTHVCVPVNA